MKKSNHQKINRSRVFPTACTFYRENPHPWSTDPLYGVIALVLSQRCFLFYSVEFRIIMGGWRPSLSSSCLSLPDEFRIAMQSR